MVNCELCGNLNSNLIKSKVSGSIMLVCKNCSTLGVVLENKNKDKNLSYTFKNRGRKNQVSFEVIPNYISVINSTLAKKNFNFHQLAKGTNIKESSLTKYLSSKIKLDIDTARKIGNFLEIDLIKEVGLEDLSCLINQDDGENNSLSLGELLKKELNK